MEYRTPLRDRLGHFDLVGFRAARGSGIVARAGGAKVGRTSMPPITAPSTLTVQAGVAKGFTVTAPEPSSDSNAFQETVTLTDTTGKLKVTGTTGVTGNNSTDLVLTGTPSVVATELNSLTVTEASVADNGDTINISDSDTNGDTPANASITVTVSATCYVRGTLILTEFGERRIEELAIFDRVITAGGIIRPIKWIGRSCYAGTFCNSNPNIRPICITAGALAEQTPWADLYVSPCHAMLLDGVLVPARELVNGTTIRQVETVDRIDYFHLELDTHDIIVANGAASETYIDLDNRSRFHNARDYAALYPDDVATMATPCAERIEAGPVLDTIRAGLAERALAFGFIPPCAQPITIAEGEITRGVIPAGVGELHLLCQSGRAPGDARLLGALIVDLRLDGTSIDLTDRALARGFHEVERHGANLARWTNGEAVLRLAPTLFERHVEIRVATQYKGALAA